VQQMRYCDRIMTIKIETKRMGEDGKPYHLVLPRKERGKLKRCPNPECNSTSIKDGFCMVCGQTYTK